MKYRGKEPHREAALPQETGNPRTRTEDLRESSRSKINGEWCLHRDRGESALAVGKATAKNTDGTSISE